MTDVILIINAGSSSIKFALYGFTDDSLELRPLYRAAIENIGVDASFIVTQNEMLQPTIPSTTNESLEVENHEAALQYILNWLEQLPRQYSVVAVGHRVVHGGLHFTHAVQVDASVLAQLQALVPLAPLHQPHALRAIDCFFSLRPQLLQIACFDTAFHTSMPMTEQLFALPRALAEQGIRRYGFHGLSYEYIASVLPGYLAERAAGRVVVAHLGHGVSLCAMQHQKSIATSMSFTPLDGLPMATRCGAIDAAVVLYLQRECGMTVDEVSDLLHHESGLLGLSGISGDMHTLLASDSTAATEAVAVFIHRIHRELGSLAAALGGLDVLVFTGGMGEHAAPVRAAICNAALWLGIALNEDANRVHAERISTDDSQVSVWVIPTDEEQIIAQHTALLLESVREWGPS